MNSSFFKKKSKFKICSENDRKFKSPICFDDKSALTCQMCAYGVYRVQNKCSTEHFSYESIREL